MTTDVMLDDDLRRRVPQLRAARRSPKQIARALGGRPATIAALVAAASQPACSGGHDNDCKLPSR
jgi:hypothetical protein